MKNASFTMHVTYRVNGVPDGDSAAYLHESEPDALRHMTDLSLKFLEEGLALHKYSYERHVDLLDKNNEIVCEIDVAPIY